MNQKKYKKIQTKISDKSIVAKTNELNEMFIFDMNIQELRFFSIYLSMIDSEDVTTRVVRIPLLDYQKLMGFKRLNISQLRESTDSLLKRIVHIPTKNGGYQAFQLFQECIVDKDSNEEWFIEFNGHEKALPYMFEFKEQFTRYPLGNILRLKSVNHFRIYELLKQYETIGKREIRTKVLRKYLGIETKEYDRWDNFKTRVLDSSQKALKELTDISFTYERGKVGRGGKWLSIIFSISKNSDSVIYDNQTTEYPEYDLVDDWEYDVDF